MKNKYDILKEKLSDPRGKRLILISHCLLNQTARYWGGASCPGFQKKFLSSILDSDSAVIQLPCPEIPAWGGPDKKLIWLPVGLRGFSGFFISLAFPLFHLWTKLSYGIQANHNISQIKKYQKSGFILEKVIGIDGSPTCGINQTLDLKKCFNYHRKLDISLLSRDAYNKGLYKNCLRQGYGIFMNILLKKLERVGIQPVSEGWSLPNELGLQED